MRSVASQRNEEIEDYHIEAAIWFRGDKINILFEQDLFNQKEVCRFHKKKKKKKSWSPKVQNSNFTAKQFWSMRELSFWIRIIILSLAPSSLSSSSFVIVSDGLIHKENE